MVEMLNVGSMLELVVSHVNDGAFATRDFIPFIKAGQAHVVDETQSDT